MRAAQQRAWGYGDPATRAVETTNDEARRHSENNAFNCARITISSSAASASESAATRGYAALNQRFDEPRPGVKARVADDTGRGAGSLQARPTLLNK